MKKRTLLLTWQRLSLRWTSKRISIALLLPLVALLTYQSLANRTSPPSPYSDHPVVTQDTIPLEDRYDDYINNPSTNPFDLADPSIIQKEVEYDPETNQYIITERIGDDYFRMPTYMSFDEYLDYKQQQQQESYFQKISSTAQNNRVRRGDQLANMLNIDPDNPLGEIDIEKNLADRLFGGSEVSIRPQGSIDLTFGLERSVIENPVLTERQQRPPPQFLFNMVPQIDVQGSIGEKLNLNMNYNSQATFDFDRQIMKLEYKSDAFSEDDIIKTIEAGNVTLPLNGTLIQGAQSLFGLKTQLQFGRFYITGIASQQKSEREEIQIKGGSQLQEYEVFADEYDENRHFLLSYFNRNTFNDNLENLPQILSLFTIEQIDVWVTNDRNVTAREGEPGPRDIIALSDLGEANVLTNPERVRINPNAPRGISSGVLNQDFILPNNDANNLYSRIEARQDVRQIDRAVAVLQNQFGLQQSKDFEKVSARRLRQGTEFTINPELGFISLNVNLQQDQVLGVAFQYSYNGQTYKVGELYNDAPATGVSADTAEIAQEVLFVKMLKSTTPRVDIPLWDLMMKNFYNIGAYQVDRKDFKLDVYYEDTGVNSNQTASDPGRGRKRFLPATNLEGRPLIQVFNLDELNVQGDPGRDGVFDFVPGLTIYPRTGRVMFPELNRFSIAGQYRSAVSSEISLGAFNIPPGSVTVRAGGQILREGIDYEIDYNIGRIRILNDAYLSSGIPVNVSFENNALFGFQTKTMVGLRADYKFSENFVLGGTYLQLLERPFTPKVNIGDDPINNKIYGLDLNYSAEAPWITRLVDKIPLIDTKAPSSITLMAEAAALRPGHPKAINENAGEDKGGILYLDDFEGSASGIDLRQPANAWVIASVPQGTRDAGRNLFPEADLINDIRYGANRALLNWYRIDPILQNDRGFANAPSDDPNPYTTTIPVVEVFPNRTVLPGQLTNIFTFDLNFEPTRRGPYNFDVPGGYPGISQGLTSSGRLEDPETRWGGIMRAININNFEQANVQFVEFWMLSPFLDIPDGNGGFLPGNSTGGDLYLDLGNISEDILRDSRKFFENGLPSPNNPDRRTTQTEWSNVPLTQQVTNAFDIDPAARAAQDVGLDGLENQGEREKYADFLSRLGGINGAARQEILEDPANDDFIHYLNDRFDDDTPILERYERFNHQQGNSQASQQGQGGLRSATNIPDAEDLDQDNTLNESEAYFQYRIPLRPGGNGRVAANRYITDEREVNTPTGRRIWYRMRIPVDDIQRKSIGGIQDLRSVRFVRMYLRDFEEQATLRFARMELVRQQWRIYQQDLAQDSLVTPDFPTAFNLNAVNIEENGGRCPFPYDLPSGIEREQNIGVFQGLQNEQSISLEVRNLADGDARGVYKTLNIDLRNYQRMKMFVHAENVGYAECDDAEDDVFCDPELEDGDVTAFIRLGSDFINNYYEYEIPLSLTTLDSIGVVPTPGVAATLQYREQLWKPSNEFDINLDWLIDAKIERNQSNTPLGEEYSGFTPQGLQEGHVIKIRGNPNLGYVKTVMIGVRNPKSPDREDHCIEIWANELRLQGLNEQGGVAGLARLDMQLADLGNISASANFSSIGFGALDEQLDERSLDQIAGFDVSTNLELSRFLPADWGVRLPAYAAYSRTTTRPKFDPYDLDIPLNENLALADSQEERQEIKERAQEVNTIKTVSLNNVGKERTSNAPPMPWDVSNFSASYAYTEAETTDPLIEYDRNENHQATLDYTYALPLRPIEPFKNLPDKDYLKVLRDLNFSPLPNSFAFSTTMYREVAETRYRFTDLDPVFSTFYNKQFTWDRTYDVQWDFSRALKMNFSAQNFSVIDEPNETELREQFPDFSDDQIQGIIRDSILTNIGNLGRPKNYGHNLNVNFTLPTRSIPFLDWVTARAQYSADYNWGAAALNVEDLGLGNTISNGNRRQVTADLSFDKLYDKWGYLKQINRPAGRRGRTGRTTRTRRPSNSKDKEGDEEEKKEREVSQLERSLIRPLLMIRKARASYSEDLATLVPGFTPTSSILGMSPGFDAPGWDFIAGLQPNIRTLEQDQYGTSEDWLHQISNARGNDSWLTSSVLLNQKVAQQYSRTMDAQLTLEPFADFRIDIEARSNFTENHTQTFKDTLSDGINNWVHAQPVNVGSMTVTYFALNTFFNGLEVSDLSELFQLYEENRLVASELLGNGVHRDPVLAGEGYTEGYGRVQPDVLIPSFLAAYRGKSINEVGVERNYVRNNLFNQLPIPNWRMTYAGLSKLPMFQDIFQSVNISHGYQSQMQINSFNTDLDFLQNGNGGINNITGNFFSRLEIPELVIQEAFAPLIGIDIRTANNISLRANVNRSRTLAMSFVSNQLAETQSQEYQIGFGWLMSDVNIGFLRNMVNNNPKRKKKKAESDQSALQFPGAGRGAGGGSGANVGDLDVNINFSYRDDVTLNHLLDQDILEPTRGTTQISFSPAAEYQLHERLALRVFFDYARTVPRVSTGFPVSNSAGGFVVRFTLNE